MDDSVDDNLNQFYDLIFANLKKKNLLKKNSVFITFIEATHNTVLETILRSAIPAEVIPFDSLKKLEEEKLIKKDEDPSKYLISARGIWAVEKNKGIINEYLLVDYLENKKCSFSFEKPQEKDYRLKVILFSLIAARAFSKDSWVDLTEKSDLHEYWKKIFDLSAKKLSEMEIITDKNRKNLYSRSSSEPPVLGLVRRLPDIKPRTRNIYQDDKSKHYWFDLPESDDDFIDTIAWLFSLIFNDRLSFDNLEEIHKYCCEMSHDYSLYVFDLDKHKFSTPKYDRLIKDALKMGIHEYT